MNGNNNMRIELHCHTKMSQMDGIASPTELIIRAEDSGHRAVAITDHGVVQAFPEAYNAAKGRSIKVIYGVEIYLLNDDYKPNGDYYHAVLLAKNATGLKNLYKVVSVSHTAYFHKRPLTLKYFLSAHREGILLGSACGAGELQTAINDSCSDERLTKIAEYYDYLEIQPFEPESVNKIIIQIGEKLGKPVVATGDVHFLDRGDEVAWRVMQSAMGIRDADKQPLLYFRSTEQMLEELAYLGEEKAFEVVVTNTHLIADMIENEIQPIPDGLFLPQIDNADYDLVKICSARLQELYGDKTPDTAKQRMDVELGFILKNGYASIYMTALQIVWKSIQDGFCVGCRGNIGSSFVAFLLGITEVDPLKYNIPFEVFAGINGDKLPYIGFNFDGEYQPFIHKYVKGIFGADKVVKCGTISAITEKAAHGFTMTYLDDEHTDTFYEEDEINSVINKLVGVKRATGQHPGGLFILPKNKEIYDFTPVQYPADDMDSDVLSTHFDYSSLTNTLLKIDLLGHGSQTMIGKLCLETGVYIKDINLDDEATLKLLINADTLGVPEFATPFEREIIKDANPKTVDDLIKIIPKAHAVEYLLMAFRVAWFKAHYPAAFYKVYFEVKKEFAGIDFMSFDISETKKRLAEIEAKSPEDVTVRDRYMRSHLEIRCEMLERGL